MKNATRIVPLLILVALAGCERRPDNNEYKVGEVGVSRAVEFGTVASMREVNIFHDKKEGGALAGAVAGAGGGAYAGGGSGSAWTAAGGAVAGAFIGDAIERQIRDTTGYEYILTMRNGDYKTIVEEKNDNNPVLKPGDKVMVQYCDAGNDHVKRCPAGSDFQRLIKVDSFPPEPKKKKRSHKKKRGDIPDDFSPDN